MKSAIRFAHCWIGVFWFVTLASVAQSAPGTFDSSYGRWMDLLGRIVTVNTAASNVNYAALKSNSKKLEVYLTGQSADSKTEFESWMHDQQLVFLINSYNAFNIKLIADWYPIQSIRDIGGLFFSLWKKKFFSLLGETTSLDELEHQKIRPVFKKPRIHFALVCTSESCPPLASEAYIGTQLDRQPGDATKMFLYDESPNHLDRRSHKLCLSSIFKCYKEDFRALEVENLDYDWSLNDETIEK